MENKLSNLVPKVELAEEDTVQETWILRSYFDEDEIKPEIYHNSLYSENIDDQFDASGIKQELDGNENNIVEYNILSMEDICIKQEYYDFDDVKIEIEDTKYEKPCFECNKCNFKTELHCSYKVHIDSCHKQLPIAGKRFKCTICSKRFKQQCFLEEHMAKHSLKRDQECEVCGKTFKWASSVRKHIIRIHRAQDKRHECNICQSKFILKSRLEAHMITHSTITPSKCMICHKKFYFPGGLVKHRNHGCTGEWECSVCHKSYRYQSRLREHEVIHSAGKIHCNLCGDKFKWRSALRRHLERRHLFKCKVCDNTFEDALNLRQHVKVCRKNKADVKTTDILQTV